MKHYKLSYDELAKQGRRYYNDTNFCTVIALAVACDLPFGKAYHTFKRVGRQHRRGTLRRQAWDALAEFGRDMNMDEQKQAEWEGRTVNQMLKDCKHWKGRYFVYINQHVIAIRDGVCEDWTASERCCKRKIQAVYKIGKKSSSIQD